MKLAPPKTVEEYLVATPEPARTTLNKVRASIRAVVPAETTEAIGYGLCMFKYKGSLVCYGAFAKHCSFFPMSATLVTQFKTELKDYQTAKGTIRFPIDKPLPTTLIKKIGKARIAQQDLRKASSRK